MRYRYHYFVAYNFTTTSNISGTGSTEMKRNQKIKSYKDVMSIQELLIDNSSNTEDCKLRELVITNWKLLKRKK